MPSASSKPSRTRRIGPALLIALVIAAWLAIAGVGGSSIGKLSQVTTNDESAYLPDSAESVLANEKLRELDDSGSLPALVILLGDDIAEQAGPPGPSSEFANTLLSQVTVGDQSITDLLASNQPVVAVPADDGSGVLLVVPLDSAAMGETDADGESLLGPTVEALRDQLPDLAGAETVHVTGPAGFGSDVSEAFAGIDGVLLLVTLSVVLVILLLVYRSVVLPLLVLFSSVSGLALAGFIVYQLAKADVVTLSGQTQGILFILTVGAATDYALLLVARYREELERHERPLDAMKVAWRACVEPIAASAGTVIAALLCLLLSGLNSNQGLGPVGALGIASAFVVSLTLLPALLLLGRGVFWPRIPRFGENRAAQHGVWGRIASFVESRPRPVWITVGLVLVAFCFAIPTFKASGTTEAEVFLTEVDAVTGQEVLDQRFAAGAADPIQIVVPAENAQQVADELTAVDNVQSAQVGQAQTADGFVEVTVIATDETEVPDLVTTVRPIVQGIDSDALVGGRSAVDVDTREIAQDDLKLIIPVVLAVVLMILILLLRSLVAPLMLITATVVSFGTALGVSALVFNHIFDFPGSDPVVPLLGFIFLVALGVDYSIFLMTRSREEVGRLGPRHGITRALTVTGGVITNAGIVLAATFAALAVLPLLFLAQIAFIVAFGVLLDTLIVRSFLVPAMAIDAGRWTWWPSRLSKVKDDEHVDHQAQSTDQPTTVAAGTDGR